MYASHSMAMSQAVHVEEQASLTGRPGDAFWCLATSMLTTLPLGRALLGSGRNALELPLCPFIQTKRRGDFSQQAQKA